MRLGDVAAGVRSRQPGSPGPTGRAARLSRRSVAGLVEHDRATLPVENLLVASAASGGAGDDLRDARG